MEQPGVRRAGLAGGRSPPLVQGSARPAPGWGRGAAALARPLRTGHGKTSRCDAGEAISAASCGESLGTRSLAILGALAHKHRVLRRWRFVLQELLCALRQMAALASVLCLKMRQEASHGICNSQPCRMVCSGERG
jgi:hypothetical protein